MLRSLRLEPLPPLAKDNLVVSQATVIDIKWFKLLATVLDLTLQRLRFGGQAGTRFAYWVNYPVEPGSPGKGSKDNQIVPVNDLIVVFITQERFDLLALLAFDFGQFFR